MTKPKGNGNTEPEESVMGFKDKQKAIDTLKVLDGRDVSYQYHVITSFVSRAKRTIQITKDEEKLTNIKEAQQVFEDWLNDYKSNNRSKENLSYLPIETVKAFRPLAKKYEILNDDFYEVYKNAKGDYKALRSVKTRDSSSSTWDVERNRQLKEIITKIKSDHIQWFETDVGEFRGFPTKEHTQCIQLGYSPEPTKLKKLISQVEKKFQLISEDEEMDLSDENEEAKNRSKKSLVGKRKRDDSSSESPDDDEDEDADEPRRKVAKKDEDDRKEKKSSEKVNDDKKKDNEETGLSFKDKQRAVDSLKSLEGRDVSYQFHAITGLIRRAERVVTCTKDETKIKNMKEAIEVYENWITDYNVNGRSKENFSYLSLDVVQAYKPLADRHKIEDRGFLKAYEQANGDYKRLRSVQVEGGKITWDIERNKNLRSLVDKIKTKHIQWFETDSDLRGLPTLEHARCIMWGFSHDAAKLKKLIPSLKEKLEPSSE